MLPLKFGISKMLVFVCHSSTPVDVEIVLLTLK